MAEHRFTLKSNQNTYYLLVLGGTKRQNFKTANALPAAIIHKRQ